MSPTRSLLVALAAAALQAAACAPVMRPVSRRSSSGSGLRDAVPTTAVERALRRRHAADSIRADGTVSLDSVRAILSALADDSMEGRATGTRGAERAARYIAREMAAIGLRPAGDSGYFQRVPLRCTADSSCATPSPAMAPRGLRVLHSWAEFDTVPGSHRIVSANVVGIIPGADPSLENDVVLIDAHYDHLGMRRRSGDDGGGAPRDSIYNGADDDASGVTAVLEIARALRQGPPPKRTLIFLTTIGEEVGLLGTTWYVEHPIRPIERMTANIEIEMIGRPDSMAGGPGHAWLTGYERSTMGEMFAAAGLPIGPDERPEQQFFMRSDNIAFAYRGVPAHTISSFNLHRDYHTPADEISRVNFQHMTAVIQAAARAARLLADGPAPTWKPDGRPVRRSRDR